MENPRRMSIRPGLIGSGIILLFMLVLSAWAWQVVPSGARIPVHWGISGEPDRFGGKFEGLLLLPLVCYGLTMLFAFLPWLEPRKLNLEKSRKAYTAIWLGLLGFMAVLHIILVMGALGKLVDMNMVMPVLMGALFVLMGNYLGKVRSNFFMGIRTPWTLSSEHSWSKTHRLGGWMFVIFGLITALAGILGNGQLVLYVLLSGLFGITAVTIVYSYFVWRADPDKHPLGRKAME